jgi:hypothetical protein
MSYLKGRKNIYSIITNSIAEDLKTKSDSNLMLNLNESNKKYNKSTPSTLINLSLIKINCGNGNKECFNCLTSYGLNNSDLEESNYLKNLKVIDELRSNKCFGVCSCILENLNLSNVLSYSIGYDINDSNIDTDSIFKKIKDKIVNGSSNINLFGPGSYSDVSSTAVTDQESSLKKIINSISLTYKETIKQILSTSQIFEIAGTGLKIKNVSITNLQDAVLTALESNCGKNDCPVKNINDITNSFISTLTSNINTGFKSSFALAYEQNKYLIWGSILFLIVILLLYFYLLIKRSLVKRSI